MYKFQQLRNFSIFFVIAPVLSLLYAYYVEYGLGIEPNRLCVYERIPHYLILITALATLIYPEKFNDKIIPIITTLLLIGTALTAYHVGIELGIFKDIPSCHTGPSAMLTTEQLHEGIKNGNIQSCKVINFKALGLMSIAKLNLLYFVGALMIVLSQNFRTIRI